jgi:hypothetical protein
LTNRTYTVGDTVIVHASVTGPDGSSFNTGTVVALLSKAGNPIGRVPLVYVQNQAIWAGSFPVNASSPSGIWSIQVSASDPYGNAGQGSTSMLASVPPQQSFLTSNLFLILLLVLTALGTGLGLFLLLKKRGVIRRELKVDFNAVQREVSQVENREFFKSLQEQLRERKRSDNG